MDLKLLTYTSWARPGITSAEVETILEAARINNPLEGISGVLIFNGVAFMQILEGGHVAIDRMAGRLRGDPRHSNMSIRDQRDIAERTFPDWSMAYLELDDGRFLGEDQVVRALRRDLPQPVRNIINGLTHTLVEPRAEVSRGLG